jgi:hypothetical protein
VNAVVLERLLALRPFKKLLLVIGDFEFSIDRPQDVRVLADADLLIRSVNGKTDFYDLRLVERLHLQDFGFDDLDKMLKE